MISLSFAAFRQLKLFVLPTYAQYFFINSLNSFTALRNKLDKILFFIMDEWEFRPWGCNRLDSETVTTKLSRSKI